MKKLSLEMLRLTSADVLERSQMKKITGGYGSGTCGYRDSTGYAVCNQSQSDVVKWQGQYGGTWCCDSCGSNGYC
jgi:natural product precursor